MPPKSYSSKRAPGAAAEDEVLSTEGLTFELDGTVFTCHGEFDGNDMADLACPLMDAGDNWYDPEALAAVATFYASVLGPATYRAFAKHRRTHRTPPSVVAQIMTDLIEELTSRPPDRPSASPPGPPATGASSRAASPSPGPGRRRKTPAGRASARTTRLALPERARGLDDGDVSTAPAPPPAGTEPDPMTGMHRTVNLGDPARTTVEPIYP